MFKLLSLLTCSWVGMVILVNWLWAALKQLTGDMIDMVVAGSFFRSVTKKMCIIFLAPFKMTWSVFYWLKSPTKPWVVEITFAVSISVHWSNRHNSRWANEGLKLPWRSHCDLDAARGQGGEGVTKAVLIFFGWSACSKPVLLGMLSICGAKKGLKVWYPW